MNLGSTKLHELGFHQAKRTWVPPRFLNLGSTKLHELGFHQAFRTWVPLSFSNLGCTKLFELGFHQANSAINEVDVWGKSTATRQQKRAPMGPCPKLQCLSVARATSDICQVRNKHRSATKSYTITLLISPSKLLCTLKCNCFQYNCWLYSNNRCQFDMSRIDPNLSSQNPVDSSRSSVQ